mmetsp:Transcript_10047/g.33173  ORF Transcript_10047/g.33173 Transcript_10047/m.33173 type:complete len:263 (+) Transcript_10047:79-867(+)
MVVSGEGLRARPVCWGFGSGHRGRPPGAAVRRGGAVWGAGGREPGAGAGGRGHRYRRGLQVATARVAACGCPAAERDGDERSPAPGGLSVFLSPLLQPRAVLDRPARPVQRRHFRRLPALLPRHHRRLGRAAGPAPVRLLCGWRDSARRRLDAQPGGRDSRRVCGGGLRAIQLGRDALAAPHAAHACGQAVQPLAQAGDEPPARARLLQWPAAGQGGARAQQKDEQRRTAARVEVRSGSVGGRLPRGTEVLMFVLLSRSPRL